MSYKIKITFEVSDAFIKKMRRMEEGFKTPGGKENSITPCDVVNEAIYSYQSHNWDEILSMRVESPLHENEANYLPK